MPFILSKNRSFKIYRMCKLTALLLVLYCYYLCHAEASTTFEDLALGGCQCKSCNCGGVTQQECLRDLQHGSMNNIISTILYRTCAIYNASLQEISQASMSYNSVNVHVSLVLVAKFWTLQTAQKVSQDN